MERLMRWGGSPQTALDRGPRRPPPSNVLPLTRGVLHTAGARLGNDTSSMTANGTTSGAAAELGRTGVLQSPVVTPLVIAHLLCQTSDCTEEIIAGRKVLENAMNRTV